MSGPDVMTWCQRRRALCNLRSVAKGLRAEQIGYLIREAGALHARSLADLEELHTLQQAAMRRDNQSLADALLSSRRQDRNARVEGLVRRLP